MVDPVDRREKHFIVAVLADVGRLDMRRVLADGLGAVVATEAIAGDIDVIEIRR